MDKDQALGELANFALMAIQAARFKESDDAVVAEIDAMAKDGASLKEISDRLATDNLAAETKAQEQVDAARLREQQGDQQG